MRLLKPAWVSHDGKPIFSIDIHPDNTRFATGGQGDNSGKVTIWNMAPVRDEAAENDPNVPKLLCQMENHLACVNCVRWSNDGKFLSSAGDDKLVMIWQASRYGGGSSVFGSNVVNHESWRVLSTLRGHSGDVLDMAWSPHDAWLATCSVDNTIVVWNAQKFPEQLSVLRGHSGLVKGVTWDPVGKYLASQSDDKSLKVWRTRDWQQEAEITEPFQECGGTTHVLRLSWSPDGQYIVSAHAMNNSGPTAQIVEREGWKTAMDFVGHRKAITVVRFNPKLLSKKLKKHSDKAHQYTCCAIGSRDRSLSIWLTALRRPLVVTHDLFTSSVVDVSWTSCGKELLCCSLDGTVAFLGFTEEELGKPLPVEEKVKLHEKIYGKSLLSKSSAASSQIIESAVLLNMQQKKQEKIDAEKAKHQMMKQNQASNQSAGMTKQIETRTKEGKRRITPIFLAPGMEGFTGAPPPTVGASEPTFSSSKEISAIGVEKRKGDPPTATWIRETSTGATCELTPKKTEVEKCEVSQATTSTAVSYKNQIRLLFYMLSEKHDIDRTPPKHKHPPGSFQEVPQKKEKRGRPRKDRSQEVHKHTPVAVVQTSAAPAAINKIVYTNSGLDLAVPSISKAIAGSGSTDSALVLEVENNVPSGGAGSLHQLRCLKGGQLSWSAVLSSPALACAGNSVLSCAACTDATISVYATASGSRLLPPLALDSKVSNLRCSAHFLMAITSRGSLHVWNITSKCAVIKNESLISLVSTSDICLDSCVLTEQGLPVISLSTGSSYTYSTDMGTWVLISKQQDTLQLCSDHSSNVPSMTTSRVHGPLSALQANQHRAGSMASRLYRTNSTLQKAATLSHLENQMSAALALMSASEFRFWLFSYVRYLVQEGMEAKLRELCNDLLGPQHRSRTEPKWEPCILTFKKLELLEELLPIFVENLTLQRLYSEYNEQLEARGVKL
ncbi:hypothetical protein CAPTEDRAFT_117691 [Capitella teleta]|uniref:Protein HIRA n=1 Tax=Capitella teleta TaxID=283909 RepID=R7TV47_CAPTE|nr:hypothetical protein CAPTEDRAFT_117691 [Capitella teleta]|eukprot:ELT95316.1 hypothetical protein CAPTEDRAFT_117691 [Capitella teleta]